MITVLLGQLPPKTYPTFEAAWDKCRYLDARRGCLCERGCRCSRYEQIKALLAEHGAIGLNAAVIYEGEDFPSKCWHVNFKKFFEPKRR